MHANARLTPKMRAEMISHLTSSNLSLRTVAIAYHVSERTVRRWLLRAKQSGFPTQLPDRSSIPRHQPRRTSSKLVAHILALRRQRRSYAQILSVADLANRLVSLKLEPERHPIEKESVRRLALEGMRAATRRST